jgi:hypothetical protein
MIGLPGVPEAGASGYVIDRRLLITSNTTATRVSDTFAAIPV